MEQWHQQSAIDDVRSQKKHGVRSHLWPYTNAVNADPPAASRQPPAASRRAGSLPVHVERDTIGHILQCHYARTTRMTIYRKAGGGLQQR